MKTPNKMIIAICHTKHTAGRLMRMLVFFGRSHKFLKLCTQPMAFSVVTVLFFSCSRCLLRRLRGWWVEDVIRGAVVLPNNNNLFSAGYAALKMSWDECVRWTHTHCHSLPADSNMHLREGQKKKLIYFSVSAVVIFVKSLSNTERVWIISLSRRLNILIITIICILYTE